MTPREQLLLELVNRARMDPVAEAARHGISLNQGLPPGTIASTPVQVLAGNDSLAFAADKHGTWMLANDRFQHNEIVGTPGYYNVQPNERMAHAGYFFNPVRYSYGENIAAIYSSSAINATSAIVSEHHNLFLSTTGHRQTMLNGDFREAGMSQVLGPFTVSGGTYNSSLVTENFARSGSTVFITGVVYNDTALSNNFFDVGEQRAGIAVSGSGAADGTGAGGGYELAYASGGVKNLTFSLPSGAVAVSVTLPANNVKVDIVNGHEVWTNATLTAVSANITELHALGISAMGLTGNSAAQMLFGNRAANNIKGSGGNDTLWGGAGKDTLTGGNGADKFSFKTASESRPTTTADVIKDFQDSGADRIDLSALWTGVFAYRGSLAFTAAHQVKVLASGADVLVMVNIDADATAEMHIRLANTTLASMAAGDFIL